MWAQRYPVQTFLLVLPLWGVYSGVAPSPPLVSKNRHGPRLVLFVYVLLARTVAHTLINASPMRASGQ